MNDTIDFVFCLVIFLLRKLNYFPLFISWFYSFDVSWWINSCISKIWIIASWSRYHFYWNYCFYDVIGYNCDNTIRIEVGNIFKSIICVKWGWSSKSMRIELTFERLGRCRYYYTVTPITEPDFFIWI